MYIVYFMAFSKTALLNSFFSLFIFYPHLATSPVHYTQLYYYIEQLHLLMWVEAMLTLYWMSAPVL